MSVSLVSGEGRGRDTPEDSCSFVGVTLFCHSLLCGLPDLFRLNWSSVKRTCPSYLRTLSFTQLNPFEFCQGKNVWKNVPDSFIRDKKHSTKVDQRLQLDTVLIDSVEDRLGGTEKPRYLRESWRKHPPLVLVNFGRGDKETLTSLGSLEGVRKKKTPPWYKVMSTGSYDRTPHSLRRTSPRRVRRGSRDEETVGVRITLPLTHSLGSQGPLTVERRDGCKGRRSSTGLVPSHFEVVNKV